jgi:hypothetical protein
MSDTQGVGKEIYWGVDLALGPDQGIISEWRRNEHGGLEFVRIVPQTKGTDGD